MLFLKYLDDFETDKETAAELNGKTYRRIIDGEYRWRAWTSFKRLMRDSSLLQDANAQNRTLYSLRRTYATLKLLRANTDIHTLAKQMGNSAAVIERHYSKFTATMAAKKLAWQAYILIIVIESQNICVLCPTSACVRQTGVLD